MKLFKSIYLLIVLFYFILKFELGISNIMVFFVIDVRSSFNIYRYWSIAEMPIENFNNL